MNEGTADVFTSGTRIRPRTRCRFKVSLCTASPPPLRLRVLDRQWRWAAGRAVSERQRDARGCSSSAAAVHGLRFDAVAEVFATRSLSFPSSSRPSWTRVVTRAAASDRDSVVKRNNAYTQRRETAVFSSRGRGCRRGVTKQANGRVHASAFRYFLRTLKYE
jgi:hypothetical protein